MERVPVSSTVVVSAGYEPESRTLEIELESGAVYQYYGVEEDIFTGLLGADSAGRYFNENIAGGGYSYQRVDA